MRKIYKPQKFLRTVLTLLITGFMSSAFAQLSGTYTIDASLPAGSGNYQSWAAFRTDLVTLGVNGAVTVNVNSSLTETAQISFDVVTGTSATNTITINGNGNFVQSAQADAVILMNGADYMTFNNLVVRNTQNGTAVKCFRVQNGSDYLSIKNSTLEFSALTSTSTSGSAYIAYTTSTTSSTTTSSSDFGSYGLIEWNTMRTTNTNSPGPAFGIAIQGNASTYSSTAQNNTIQDNTIQNFYSMAIRMYNTNGNQVYRNDISRANATSYNSSSTLYGIYSAYSYAANRSTKLEGNSIHDLPFNGATTSSAPSTVYGFYTQFNYGNATNRFSVSSNSINRLRATQQMHLGYSYYDYYYDLLNNFANDADVPTSTSSSVNFWGWNNSYSQNEYRFNGNTVQYCDGGYNWYGVRNSRPGGSVTVAQMNGNSILNNINAYWSHNSIFCEYPYNSASNPISISDNTIKDNRSNYYYHYSVYAAWYGNFNIERNNIQNNRNLSSNSYYHYSIYNYYNYNTRVNSNLIVNCFSYNYTYHIYNYAFMSGNYSTEVRQNTIRHDGTQNSNYYHYIFGGIYQYQYYHTNIRVIGNILDYSNMYYCYPVYTYNANGTTPYVWDYNSYYVNNIPNQYWYCNVGTGYNFTQWSTNGFAGPNEIYQNNGHNFAGNYASNRFTNQNNVPTVSTNSKDLYSVNRNPGFSDKGAVEGVLDIAQTSNDFSPSANECAGYAPTPTLTFANNFGEDVTGFMVACSDNGVIKSTVKFTNTIPVNGTNTVTFPAIQFSQSGTHVVKFFLLNADDLPSNDTTTYTFNILPSPGGATVSHNSGLSSAAAMFKTDGKPDVTFPNEALVYNIGEPSTVGYTNAEYGTKWTGSATARTINGFNANATVSTNGAAPFRVTLNAPKAWEDSTIEISMIIHDMVTNCDTIYKRRVLIAPKAVPNFKLPAALCEKSDLIFESTSTVSSGSIEYVWDFGDGTPTTTEASPSHNYAAFGQYVVTLSTTTNPYGFTTIKKDTIDVTEVPLATIVNTNACEGNAVRLRNTTVYGGSGTISYEWNYGDGSPLNITGSAADILKNYSAPGGYKVSLTASADGCSNTTTKVVYLFARPVASGVKVSGNCLNNEFTFENNSSITLGQFGNLWDFDDAGNKATVEEPTYTFNTAGLKNVKLKVVSEFGCADSVIIPVTVKQTPSTDFSYPFACSRTATPFTNTTDLNGEILQTYMWNFGDGSTSTSASPMKSWSNIGPRVVTLTTYLVNGCSTSESKTIDVGVQPQVNFTAEDKCAGSEVPFTNLTSYSQGNIVYTWTFGDGNSSNQAAPVHAYNSGISQSYTVQLKASILGGCADSMSKSVTINPLPNTCGFDITGNINAAKTSPLVFTPTGGSTSGINYTWITGDGNSVNSANAGTTYTYNAPGKYCVTMIASNAAGCECSTTKCVTMSTDITDAESMNNAVSVYPNPNGGVFSVSLSAEISGSMNIEVYNTLGELVKTISTDSNSASVDMTEFASGVYTVKVMAENQMATKKITITK